MRIPLATLVALVFSLSFANAAEKKVSLISAFAGPHNGTAFIVGTATTVGNFQASKKKEQGVATFQSTVTSSGTTFFFLEQFIFSKKSVTWTLTQSSAGGGGTFTASGVGTASIKKNVITYSLPFTVSGSSGVGFLSGTMRLAKNHSLAIQETISLPGGSSTILFYQLDGKKPRKPRK